MITATQPGVISRSDPSYHNERLRVTVRVDDMKGHHVLKAGRFLMTTKKFAHDGKMILWFENQYSSDGEGWDLVGRNGVIRIPVSFTEAKHFVEGLSYTLYLYKW